MNMSTLDGPPPAGQSPEPPTQVTEPVGPSATTEPQLAPGAPVPVGPFDHTDDDDRRNLALLFVIAGCFIAILGVAGITVWATHHDSHQANASSSPATSTVGTGASVDSSTTTVATSGAASSAAVTVTTAGHTNPTVAPPATVAPTTVVPTTVSTAVGFSATSAPAQVACPTDTSYPSAHLTWTAVNATSVDLSVDGAGVYQSGLPATGSFDFGYGCPGPHTLTLTAHGSGGTTAVRTFTIASHP
jgi:hypothetical protein